MKGKAWNRFFMVCSIIKTEHSRSQNQAVGGRNRTIRSPGTRQMLKSNLGPEQPAPPRHHAPNPGQCQLTSSAAYRSHLSQTNTFTSFVPFESSTRCLLCQRMCCWHFGHLGTSMEHANESNIF